MRASMCDYDKGMTGRSISARANINRWTCVRFAIIACEKYCYTHILSMFKVKIIVINNIKNTG